MQCRGGQGERTRKAGVMAEILVIVMGASFYSKGMGWMEGIAVGRTQRTSFGRETRGIEPHLKIKTIKVTFLRTHFSRLRRIRPSERVKIQVVSSGKVLNYHLHNQYSSVVAAHFHKSLNPNNLPQVP